MENVASNDYHTKLHCMPAHCNVRVSCHGYFGTYPDDALMMTMQTPSYSNLVVTTICEGYSFSTYAKKISPVCKRNMAPLYRGGGGGGTSKFNPICTGEEGEGVHLG